MPRAAVPPPIRLALMLGAALFSAYGTWVFRSSPRPSPSDLWVVWQGARDLWHNIDPYTAIGTSQPFPTRLFYPLPALLALLPFSWIPIRVVDPLLVGLAGGTLAWWLTADGISPGLLVFVSVPWMWILQTSQVWDAILLLAVPVPWCGVLLAAKPTVGAAIWAIRPRLASAVPAMVLVGITLQLWPAWFPEWRAAVASAHHFRVPLLVPGGVALICAGAAWRDWRARLLLVLACAPQTMAPYAVAILFLIPRTWPEATLLLALSSVAAWRLDHVAPLLTLDGYAAWSGPWLLVCCYFPCLVMVLRDRREA